jgi:oligopeptide transport system substrate-binding protein
MPVNCTRRTTPVEKGTKDKVLLIGNQVEPQDLDPHIITGVQEYHIVSALFEGLVNEDPEDLHPIPGAARSWTKSEDGLFYTFILQKNGAWSNGDPVRASDFVFSFRRILSPGLASEYAYMLFCIKNAEAYNKGTLIDFSKVGASAPDDTTLTISLAKPTPYFLSLITHSAWYPVHPPTILKFGAIDQRGSDWTRPGNLVSNGPFVLTKWMLNTVIEVHKNPRYWDSHIVRLNGIRFYPIENNQTEERAFRTGQLHITTNVPVAKIQWYRDNRPSCLRIDPYLATYFYLVNIHRPPFDDVRVRRALSLSIDRNGIVEHVVKGNQLPAFCFTPPNTHGYTGPAEIDFDTMEARRLLRDAGFGEGRPFPRFSLLYNTSESHHVIAQAIQEMWKKYLHIDVTLKNQEWKVYLASTHDRDYDIARMGWTGDYNDPVTFLDMWITGGGNNRVGFSEARYDSLINAASFESDSASRYALLKRAESLLLERMPIIPIYFYTNPFLLHPSVQKWRPNILNHHPYKFVDLDDAGLQRRF